VINLVVANSLLTLEIEDSDSNERWTGEFTSQYIEEITLKAGNFKKFSTFVKMVCSGFGKENESVFMDILTAGDLEMLKARKAGKAPSSQSSVSSGGGGGKRYVILTYSGEFDRVHYPLPLSFEAAPNPESLQRCVARLRRRLSDSAEQQGGLDEANSGAGAEKDLRQIIANLRQENTQLRHRLRQVESRSKGAAGGGLAAQGSAAQAGVINEVTGQNAKLKRQVEALRKELSDATALHERQRLESLKELNKWKLRVGAAARDRLEFYSREAGKSPSPAPTGRDGANGSGGGSAGEEEALRRRVRTLEQQLRAVRRPSPSGPGSAPTSAQRDRPWNDRPYIPPVGTAARNRSTTPPPLPLAHGPRSSGGSGSGSTAASWSPSALARRPPVARGSPAVPPRGPRRPAPAPAPARSSSAPSAASGAGRPRSASPSLSAGQHRISSSVGGRFDPTLYQQQRAERIASRDGSRPFTAGGRRPQQQDDSPASSTARRYRSSRESGYSSADSANNSRRSRSAPGSAGSKAATSKSPKAGRRRKGKTAAKGQQPPSDSEDDGAAAVPRPKRASAAGGAGAGAGAGARRGIAERSLIDSPLSDAPKSQPASGPASAPASAVPKPFPTGVAGPGDAPRPSSAQKAPLSPARPSSSSGPRAPASPSSLAKARPAPAASKTSGARDGALSSSQSSLRSSLSVSPRSSLEKALASSSGARGSPLRASVSASASTGKGGKGDEEISEIDRRIQALQSYLDNAR